MRYPYSVQWPRDNLYMNTYIHDVLGYRYNWHDTDYELDILVRGSAEFNVGGERHLLAEDDVILINPLVGHASFALEKDSLALVLHFSASAFRPYLDKGQTCRFTCASDPESRSAPGFRQLRFYTARIMEALMTEDAFSLLTAKGSLELLLSVLWHDFPPETVPEAAGQDESHQEALANILTYINANYASKITLEELAHFSQYNRTYISTIFHNGIGMNFSEYLMRIRLQHAVFDLGCTRKSLTDVALDNGFPELKLFNSRFRETFHLTPAEYRRRFTPDKQTRAYDQQNYFLPETPEIREKISEYLQW